MSGRCGILGVGRGRAAGLDRETERRRILNSFEVLDISPALRALVVEALESKAWDWFRDCDGCTFVSEVYWPTIYFPPCLRHDFDCIRGQGGWQACLRFYRLQRAYGVENYRSGIRTAAVTAAWYGWLRWRRKG
ncbi:MAG: hypothetical protein PHR35_15965 [Kiritimatiellae bacterium]|nr:hypothetical protein [Kiritimatiellia bacterium]